jgi:hypothetical protein
MTPPEAPPPAYIDDMADGESPSPPAGAPPADRHAYLEEQIARQARGEPIDVEWVKAELERVRQEQGARIASTQRKLRWLVICAAGLLLILWLKNGGLTGTNSYFVLGLIVVGLLASLTLVRTRR